MKQIMVKDRKWNTEKSCASENTHLLIALSKLIFIDLERAKNTSHLIEQPKHALFALVFHRDVYRLY